MSEPSKMPPKKNSSWPEVMRTLGPYMNIGWMFVVAMVLGIYGGYRADLYLGTKPWLMVVGALLGMAAGFYNFFMVVLRK